MDTYLFTRKKSKKSTHVISFMETNGVQIKQYDLDSDGISVEMLLELLKGTERGLKEILKKSDEEILNSDEPLSKQLEFLSNHTQNLKVPLIVQKRKERRGENYYFVTGIAPSVEELPIYIR